MDMRWRVPSKPSMYSYFSRTKLPFAFFYLDVGRGESINSVFMPINIGDYSSGGGYITGALHGINHKADQPATKALYSGLFGYYLSDSILDGETIKFYKFPAEIVQKYRSFLPGVDAPFLSNYYYVSQRLKTYAFGI
jgi:hypothetical protein